MLGPASAQSATASGPASAPVATWQAEARVSAVAEEAREAGHAEIHEHVADMT